ncbi:UDP-N-acetylglucosamine 2-epimerase (non-hydrolyzing) [Bacteroidales bacterium OttesenSCG-928-C03]|nr:UDP-N-acetylglucosamine 2-epimerase (non-hydrolyzing) [Bacteroidales bacterium OttesenSCG-928-E04]MDL2308684.1 UDP-N-acetylglucosamine 2-epimerase (non-hydrolyzing) [Bacteroidales bacterium OttesenSCG-928-C03]MDL2325956.1 UDP-N-acetylglucosamine 2-epimerase (non-hydrolyzing) [Bacteroidales bacterium OttesenSCG-928-A14]
MKIITVIGARPQFIKAAPISRAIDRHADIQEIVIHTGQHFDDNMSSVFFEEMDIRKPAYNLGINSLSHGAMTGLMLAKIEEILLIEKPDWMMVYGDTNSTLAGALAAKKIHINVAHVESGLRSFNMRMPEEVNRVLTDRISDLLFCPTPQAVDNLLKEGYANRSCHIVQTGDVMLDAARLFTPSAKKPPVDIPERFILCTFHRAENTDNPETLSELIAGIDEIAQEVAVVCPLHPRTKAKLLDNGYDLTNSPILFIEPVGYLEMIWLLSHASLVMTDSGGLQKEAYFFQKQCITLRNETEWVELVELGANHLAGTNRAQIVDIYHDLLNPRPVDFSLPLYGDGNASEKIVQSMNYY